MTRESKMNNFFSYSLLIFPPIIVLIGIAYLWHQSRFSHQSHRLDLMGGLISLLPYTFTNLSRFSFFEPLRQLQLLQLLTVVSILLTLFIIRTNHIRNGNGEKISVYLKESTVSIVVLTFSILWNLANFILPIQ